MLYYICFAVWFLTLVYLLFLRYAFLMQESVLFFVFFSALGALGAAVLGFGISLIFSFLAGLIAPISSFPPRAVEWAGVAFRVMQVALVFIGTLFTPLARIYGKLKERQKEPAYA